MAKGKHATALFEVIHGDRRAERSIVGSGALRTPKWWFKGRSEKAAPSIGDSPVAPLSHSPTPAPEPPPEVSDAPTETFASAPSISRPRFHVGNDADNQRIHFDLSYSSAILAGFGVFVVICLAYWAGRHNATGPRPVIAAETSEEIKNGPVLQGALEPRRGGDSSNFASAGADDSDPTPSHSAVATTTGEKPKPTWNEPKPPATHVVDDVRRDIGLNYVIVQSYPDEKSAKEACDLLIKNNILCTVEKGPQGWVSMTWYSVIGIRGFDKLRNSKEYDQYVKAIEDVGTKFGGNSKFKKFEPKAFKWKEAK